MMVKKVMEELYAVYEAKNADYGDSFSKTRRKYDNAIMIRLSDKFHRLETLYKNKDRHVSDESIDDTLGDLANYCTLELAKRKEEKDNERKF